MDKENAITRQTKKRDSHLQHEIVALNAGHSADARRATEKEVNADIVRLNPDMGTRERG